MRRAFWLGLLLPETCPLLDSALLAAVPSIDRACVIVVPRCCGLRGAKRPTLWLSGYPRLRIAHNEKQFLPETRAKYSWGSGFPRRSRKQWPLFRAIDGATLRRERRHQHQRSPVLPSGRRCILPRYPRWRPTNDVVSQLNYKWP